MGVWASLVHLFERLRELGKRKGNSVLSFCFIFFNGLYDKMVEIIYIMLMSCMLK